MKCMFWLSKPCFLRDRVSCYAVAARLSFILSKRALFDGVSRVSDGVLARLHVAL